MSKIYLIAGEPSGDILGGRLIAAIRDLAPSTPAFFGVGGDQMQAAGLRSLFPMHELSVMGLAEVVPQIPKILRRVAETAADIRANKPDVVVTIDAPDFCLRVAKRLKGSGIPIVHYVAPSVWAWRPGRAQKLAGLCDHVMCLLPFEPPYFERAGMRASFVGHSILESGAGNGDGTAFRKRHGIPTDAPLLAVLPGSRLGEIHRHLPVFSETLTRVRAEVGPLHIVLPTLSRLKKTIDSAVQADPATWADTHVVEGEAEKYDAFAAADAALAASGTVSLELAMASTPSLIAYKVAPLSAWLARRLLTVKYASIVNLILNKSAMPEFIQENCTADKLAPALIPLLQQSGDARSPQDSDIAEALAALHAGNDAPSINAARVVLNEAARGCGSSQQAK